MSEKNLKNNQTKEKKILIILFIIFSIAGFAYLIIDPSGEVKKGRTEQQAVQKAVLEARLVERKIFCEKYRRIVKEKSNAPYAYKYCYETEK